MDTNENERTRARRKALRAAQVVTLGLALSGMGCASVREQAPADAALAMDAAPAMDAQSPVDGGAPEVDAAVDGALADAGTCGTAEDRGACCEELGWPCDFESGDIGCCAWGPYVPPAIDSLPRSRSLDA